MRSIFGSFLNLVGLMQFSLNCIPVYLLSEDVRLVGSSQGKPSRLGPGLSGVGGYYIATLSCHRL